MATRSMSTCPMPGRPMTPRRFTLVLLVFAVLGPPLGALVFLSPMLASSLAIAIADGARTGELLALPQLIGMIMLFSYPFGGLPAVMSGAILGWHNGRSGNFPGYAPAALIGSAISFLAIVAFMLVDGGGRETPTDLLSLGAVFAIVGAVAAVICTAVCRWSGLFAAARG